MKIFYHISLYKALPHIKITILISGEVIYTCKMIQPANVSRFRQPVHFSRFKPGNLLLSTARFSGYNLEKYSAFTMFIL
jgi:hypothetical protein